MDEPLIRNISDTARWVAHYRARENDRPDAVFRDRYARALAGERGEQIANALPFAGKNEWSFIARTYLIDRIIAKEVAAGADTIVNLAAGLDARPYRMQLPPALTWIEVDLPEILEYKQGVLADATPACKLERIPLDLSNHDARRGLFADLARRARRALIVAEGLLIYLMPAEVGALSRDLSAPASFVRWVVDIASPGLLELLNKGTGELVRQAGAPYLFAPPEGPEFFVPHGWEPVEVRSILKTARSLGRLPPFFVMLSFLPESKGRQGSRPWSGIVVLARS